MGRVPCLFVLSVNGIFAADTLSEDEDDPEVSEAVSVRANLFGRSSGYSPSPGGPFSALIPSMWPLDLLASLAQVSQHDYRPSLRSSLITLSKLVDHKATCTMTACYVSLNRNACEYRERLYCYIAYLSQPEDVGCHHECRYDEFGFRLEDVPNGKRGSSSMEDGGNCKNPPALPLEVGQHREEWIGYLEFAHSNNTHAELTWDQVDHYLDKTDKLCSMITEKGEP